MQAKTLSLFFSKSYFKTKQIMILVASNNSIMSTNVKLLILIDIDKNSRM